MAKTKAADERPVMVDKDGKAMPLERVSLLIEGLYRGDVAAEDRDEAEGLLADLRDDPVKFVRRFDELVAADANYSRRRTIARHGDAELYVLDKKGLDPMAARERVEAILDEAKALMRAKDADYSGEVPFQGYRNALRFGILPVTSVLLRMGEKWTRVEQLAGDLGVSRKVEDETLRKTLLDFILCGAIAINFLDELDGEE